MLSGELQILVVVAFLLVALVALMSGFFVRDALREGDKVSRLDTGPRRYKRNTRTLLGLMVLAVVYVGLLSAMCRLTGINLLDGGIGVALGLYICAHPAANAVNMLFFERGTLQSSSGGSLVRWLLLNLLVLLAGWMVLFVAIRQLVAESP